MRRILGIIVVLCMFGANPSFARIMMFGDDESLHKIQDVDIRGPNGKTLYLGYKTKTSYFGAGVNIKDEGYVLLVVDDVDTYYPLGEDDIKKFQNSGMLPSPMPKYKIGILKYIFGYYLWIALSFLALWAVKEKFFKKKPVPVDE